MSANCRTTTLGRHIDRHIGRVSADISVDMSVNMSTDTSRPIYRPSVGRHIDRHIGRALFDMSTDTRPICRSICRPIYRSRGAQNTHGPNFLWLRKNGKQKLKTSSASCLLTNCFQQVAAYFVKGGCDCKKWTVWPLSCRISRGTFS